MKAKYLKTKYKQDNMFILFSGTIVLAIFKCPMGTDLYPKIEQYFNSEQDDLSTQIGENFQRPTFEIKLSNTIDNDVWSITFTVKYTFPDGEIIKEKYELRRHEGDVL